MVRCCDLPFNTTVLDRVCQESQDESKEEEWRGRCSSSFLPLFVLFLLFCSLSLQLSHKNSIRNSYEEGLVGTKWKSISDEEVIALVIQELPPSLPLSCLCKFRRENQLTLRSHWTNAFVSFQFRTTELKQSHFIQWKLVFFHRLTPRISQWNFTGIFVSSIMLEMLCEY